MKLGRNEPCHCGSGAKYKRCCLGKDEEAERQAKADADAAEAETSTCLCPDCEQDVYDLSAEAMDLIEDGHLDEAEPICIELCERFPELVEGPELMAGVLEGRGDGAGAAALYRRAAEIALTAPEGWIEPGVREHFLAKAEQLDPGPTV
jgi:SEC-C motif